MMVMNHTHSTVPPPTRRTAGERVTTVMIFTVTAFYGGASSMTRHLVIDLFFIDMVVVIYIAAMSLNN